MMWGYGLGLSVFRLFQIGVDVFLMSPGAPDPHQISTGSHPVTVSKGFKQNLSLVGMTTSDLI